MVGRTVTDAERLAARLSPDVLSRLLAHLERIDGPARSELVLHHGLDGVARGIDAHLRVKTVDFPAPIAVPSGR